MQSKPCSYSLTPSQWANSQSAVAPSF